VWSARGGFCTISIKSSERPLTLDFLESHLAYQPLELKFGTSGRRGEVIHLTQLEVYINALAELRYLQGLSPSRGGIAQGQEFFFACDLRPSSFAYVTEQGGRGEIAQAIERAIRDSGMQPVFLGRIPTPALTLFAISRQRGSMMITGSHIPFDRNGYKANTSQGELLKEHEEPISQVVKKVRNSVYSQSFATSLFDEQGLFRTGHAELPPEISGAKDEYLRRYTTFFQGSSLKGKRLLVYQHSAVGRDLLVKILRLLGAEVIPAGRSDTFVPIDTENIDEAQLAVIQVLVDEASSNGLPIDAVVSVDGDSDRPLILGVDAATRKVNFFGGDLVGMVTAEYLGADAVVVPISCNDGIDRGKLASVTEPKTRIGSPYVIAGMEAAQRKGRKVICGWEANGGFLTGSDIERSGQVLMALPTRDAFLPILSTLFSAQERGLSLTERFAKLPRRFSRAALLKEFPRPISMKIVERFSASNARIRDVSFGSAGTSVLDQEGGRLQISEAELQRVAAIRTDLESFFPGEMGFPSIVHLNYTDGVRITFDNEDVAHFRPSGNADELRMYAVADTLTRSEEIARWGIATPGGILRAMEGLLK
jgi:phosphomannomutase